MRLSFVCRPGLPTVLSVLIVGSITLAASRPALGSDTDGVRERMCLF